MTIRRRARHAARSGIAFEAIVVALLLVGGAATAWRLSAGRADDRSPRSSGGPLAPGGSPSADVSGTPASPTPGASPTGVVTPGPINTSFPGLTTFRGNATRDYYGEGPVPMHPKVLWRYPASGGLCSVSVDNKGSRTWCGTGWTGQPNVIPRKDGTIEIRIGAYDGHYHFLNGRTGQPLRPDLVTGDLAKGSATSDAEGYPLYYAGSRDNYLRVVALDRPKPTVLWSMNAETSVPNPVWNNDWDGAPLEIGDYLLEGGENSWFYVIKLNRGYDASGKVTVDPRIVMRVPGWDQQEIDAIGDTDVSIENSVAFADGVAYFSNSGGLVQGWDISDILNGGTHYQRVFRFWDGDDTDSSIVIDPQGYLYVARHMEENVPRPQSAARDRQIGSLMKLDPRNSAHPLVWSVHLGSTAPDGGILSTPALYDGVVFVTPTDGELVAVDQRAGKLLWRISLPSPSWSSPVPVDGVLLEADCLGVLHAYDVSHPRLRPPELWHLQVASGCIESTPAVWHGMIWVGSRDGGIYGIGVPR